MWHKSGCALHSTIFRALRVQQYFLTVFYFSVETSGFHIVIAGCHPTKQCHTFVLAKPVRENPLHYDVPWSLRIIGMSVSQRLTRNHNPQPKGWIYWGVWLAGGQISDFVKTHSDLTQDGEKFTKQCKGLSRCHWENWQLPTVVISVWPYCRNIMLVFWSGSLVTTVTMKTWDGKLPKHTNFCNPCASVPMVSEINDNFLIKGLEKGVSKWSYISHAKF